MRRWLRRATAPLCAAVVLATGSCAARQQPPEVVGVDYETRVSGAGVVSAETDSDGRTIEPPAAAAEAQSGSVAAAAAATSDAEQALLRAENAARDAAPASAEPVPASPPPAFVQEDELRVVDVRRASDSAGSVIVAQLSRDASDATSFELSAPRRCVVDVSGPRPARDGQQTIATGDPRAPKLRVGGHGNRLRLVLDVAPGVLDPCVATTDGSAVLLELGGRPQGAPPVELWSAPSAPEGAEAHAAYVLASATGSAPATGAMAEAAASPSTNASVAAGSEVAAIPVVRDAPPEPPPAPRVEKADDGIRSTLSAPPAPSDPPPPPLPSASRPVVVTSEGTAMDVTDVKKRYTGRRISLEFKDADILNVLRIIADVAHRNIVATDDVKGQVTIVLYDVPWDQALDILLKSTGLEMVEYDDVITVSTSKRLEEERRARLAARQAGVQLEPLRTEYIRVNYVKANELARILGGGATQSAAAAAATEAISGATAGIESASQRQGLLSSRGLVQVNEATNTLIVRDVEDGIRNARELVRQLDVQTPQVAIQGLIFEADTNLDRDLGIRWGARYIASPETGNPTGRNFPGRIGVGGAGPNQTDPENPLPVMFDFPASAVQPGAGSTLGLVLGSLSGSTTIDAELTALEQAGKGKVISRPKVITLNNAEAVIQSLEILRVRLPSTGTVINTGPGGVAGGQVTATQAIDTGIILRVTPQVSSDGYVLMQLFVKSSVPSQVETDNIPNEISRQATSQVLVREGETVVIGGVYRQRANTAESGVPYLRTVPVLGWLFKNNLLRDNRQELLVFITPKIVWRQPGTGPLPTAAELWNRRDRTAYQLEPTASAGGSVAPVAALQ
jgi:type IV pilus secretin PilQ/predicted competence protein